MRKQISLCRFEQIRKIDEAWDVAVVCIETHYRLKRRVFTRLQVKWVAVLHFRNYIFDDF